MDRLYRVYFSAKPIAVHAASAQQARDKAVQYALQPDCDRIIVEEGKEGETCRQ